MLNKIIYGAFIVLLSYTSFAHSATDEIPEILYCRQTSYVHDRIWESCLYSMGELVAKQVKDSVGSEDFSKYTSTLTNKCRNLRKKLEKESGGGFPGHEPVILACNVENWADVRNKLFKELYPTKP